MDNTNSGEQRRVVLVDTTAFIHSSWHGMPPSSTKGVDGLCHRALRGVLNKIHQLEKDHEWDALINVVDPEGGSLWRKALYPDYKANRPAHEEDFTRQKAEVPDALRELGLAVALVPGEESDDVIASLARQEREKGAMVMVFSPDKDLSQLVDDKTWLLRPIKDEQGRAAFSYLDEQGVLERMGVWPKQVADLLALTGDTSDNIPGVEKVGPKTAAKWLAEHGDLQTLLMNADKIKGQAGENLRKATAWLPVTQQLTRLKEDIAFPEDFHGIRKELSDEKLREIQERFGFPGWMGRLESARWGAQSRQGRTLAP